MEFVAGWLLIAGFGLLGVGLANVFGVEEQVRLLYLWFDTGCGHATEHRLELQRFQEHIGDDIAFRSLTYQELFSRLKAGPESAPGHVSYLASRYFAG